MSVFFAKLIQALWSTLLDKLARLITGLLTGGGVSATVVNSQQSSAPILPGYRFTADIARFIAMQMVQASLIGLCFGVLTTIWLWSWGLSPFLPNNSARIRARCNSIFWLYVGAVMSSYLAQTTLGSLDSWRVAVAKSPLSNADLNWIFLYLALGFAASLLIGGAILAGVLFTFAPASVRVVAAPPLLRPVFRFAITHV